MFLFDKKPTDKVFIYDIFYRRHLSFLNIPAETKIVSFTAIGRKRKAKNDL